MKVRGSWFAKFCMVLVFILLIVMIAPMMSTGIEQDEVKMENVQAHETKVEITELEKTLDSLEEKTSELEKDLEKLITQLKELEYYIEDVPLTKEMQKVLYDTCQKYNVDYLEAHAVMKAENPTYNPELRHLNKNKTYDTGLFQVNDCNRDEIKKILGITNLKDPYQNIEAGVYILSKLNKYEGHYKFMAYNFGEYGMKKHVNKGVTSSSYSRKVMKYVDDFKDKLYGEGL